MEIHGYRIGRKIAQSEFCSLHNALDLTGSKTVSVRIYDPRLVRHPGFCAGFSRFAESVLGEHLGVMVGLLHYQASETACYAITDYFPSLPLSQAKAVQMPVKTLLQGSLEIAATIDLLHQRDLVHGALRPGNLLFNDSMKPSLGLGMHRPEGKGSRPLPIGNATAALYLPPEGIVTPDADYYALGISLYRLLFGHPPFDVQNPRLQHQQKQKGLVRLPGDGREALLPLFQGLLQPDPEQRIGSSDEFWQAANTCGYRLLQLPFKVHPSAQDTPAPAKPAVSSTSAAGPASGTPADSKPNPPENAAGPLRKPVLIASGIAAILGVALLAGFMMPADRNPNAGLRQTHTASNLDAMPVQEKTGKTLPAASPEPGAAANPTATHSNVVARPVKKIPREEQLYLRARKLFSQGNPGAALISVNQALKIDPRQPKAQQLRKAIRKELEVRRILERAKEQLLAGRLDSPAGDNALESYRNLATLLPQNDPRMQDGLSRLAKGYLESSRKLAEQNELDRALELADSGARLLPDFAPLQDLRKDLQRQQAERQRRLGKSRKQKTSRRARIKQKRAWLQKKRKQWLQAFDKALTRPASGIEQAMTAYDELRKLKTPARRLGSLRKRLVQACIDLSAQQIAARDFSAAKATLEQASRIGGNKAVEQQRTRLQQAMEQQREQVTRLLSEAQRLTKTARRPEDLHKAAARLKQASDLDPKDPRIAGIREQLLIAIDLQVVTTIEHRRFDDSDRLISLGRETSGGDPHWQVRSQELQHARAEEKRKSLPVIGTF